MIFFFFIKKIVTTKNDLVKYFMSLSTMRTRRLVVYHNLTSYQNAINVPTAVCRIMFDLHFYSSKTPILRVVGGIEGVVPNPCKGGSK